MGVKNQADRLAALALGDLICLPMAIRAAINLKVFDIIDKAGADAPLTPSEIVCRIPTSNPNAAATLERILRILAANSLLTMSYKQQSQEEKKFGDDKEEAAYGLSGRAECLVQGEDGASAAAVFLLCVDKATVASFYHLEDAVLEDGCVPFERAHGASVFEFGAKESQYSKMFHEAMSNISTIALREVLEVYKGFDEVKEMVDLGGGVGTCMSMIVKKYPHVRGINFDLPYVIDEAPQYPGIKHVGGNMFEDLPRAETFFMKAILHDWDDESCLKLLRKCWESLPEGGKVINVEFIVPPQLRTDFVSRLVTGLDITMMACTPRGKERTIEELDCLAKSAGFVEVKDFPIAHALHVIEFHKGGSLPISDCS